MRVIGALRGRSLEGFFAVAVEEVEVKEEGVVCCSTPAVVGLLFCASPSLSPIPTPASLRSHGADGGQVLVV